MDYHCCPECGLHHIQQRKTAQTVGQVLGAVGGIAVGMLFPFFGNKLPIPKLPQQVYQYITFAKTGSLVGGEIGMVIDEHLLNNCVCMACGHEFKQRRYWD
ncbi:hypothetical protein LVJ82_12560 [Vitreoscilla massiliensis]|uniref:Uncharacterized protein n=1 Tax=Vitreoscilla massiliensis TaxID=1689272 RepID=A0ABY4E4D8_9NEIS|nr:hypothetical protein [Vitreoscilla massiliensis]UOO88302.1 hypothetical protein LVJ82_12560 [Vitreoscilla massiliensis]